MLILGDYPAGSGIGVTTFAMDDHPGGMQYEPYLTDNRLTDFNNDGLPEIAVARMPAADGNEAAGMIYKVINYERHPYDDASYYDSPVTAMGYEESRWFQLCSEVVNGFSVVLASIRDVSMPYTAGHLQMYGQRDKILKR